MLETRKNTKTAMPAVTLKTVLSLAGVLAVGLLVARVRISYSVWPFGVAYVAAAFLNKEIMNPYAALAGVMCGLCTNIYTAENIRFMFASVAVSGVFMIVVSLLKLRRKYIFAAAGILVTYTVCTLCFKRLLILNILSSAVEASIAVIAAFMLNTVIKLVFTARRTVLNDVELVSLGFTAVLSVLGVGQISAAGVYLRSLQDTLLVRPHSWIRQPATDSAETHSVQATFFLPLTGQPFFLPARELSST